MSNKETNPITKNSTTSNNSKIDRGMSFGDNDSTLSYDEYYNGQDAIRMVKKPPSSSSHIQGMSTTTATTSTIQGMSISVASDDGTNHSGTSTSGPMKEENGHMMQDDLDGGEEPLTPIAYLPRYDTMLRVQKEEHEKTILYLKPLFHRIQYLARHTTFTPTDGIHEKETEKEDDDFYILQDWNSSSTMTPPNHHGLTFQDLESFFQYLSNPTRRLEPRKLTLDVDFDSEEGHEQVTEQEIFRSDKQLMLLIQTLLDTLRTRTHSQSHSTTRQKLDVDLLITFPEFVQLYKIVISAMQCLEMIPTIHTLQQQRQQHDPEEAYTQDLDQQEDENDLVIIHKYNKNNEPQKHRVASKSTHILSNKRRITCDRTLEMIRLFTTLPYQQHESFNETSDCTTQKIKKPLLATRRAFLFISLLLLVLLIAIVSLWNHVPMDHPSSIDTNMTLPFLFLLKFNRTWNEFGNLAQSMVSRTRTIRNDTDRTLTQEQIQLPFLLDQCLFTTKILETQVSHQEDIIHTLQSSLNATTQELKESRTEIRSLNAMKEREPSIHSLQLYTQTEDTNHYSQNGHASLSTFPDPNHSQKPLQRQLSSTLKSTVPISRPWYQHTLIRIMPRMLSAVGGAMVILLAPHWAVLPFPKMEGILAVVGGLIVSGFMSFLGHSWNENRVQRKERRKEETVQEE